DEVWREVRPTAVHHGLQSCWTVVILSLDGAPLGLLTVFCRCLRSPSPREVNTLDMAAKLATICIEHHNTTRQLAHLVRHDPLTGLPNRLMSEDRIQQALALCRRSGRLVAIMMLDIDNFKAIHDSLGHQTG